MVDNVAYDALCRIGTQQKVSVTRRLAELRETIHQLDDSRIDHVTAEDVTAARVGYDQARVELSRHVAHCLDGCRRASGQSPGGLQSQVHRAPSHQKPPLPPTGELAELLRDGATLEELAEIYERHPATLQGNLNVAGWGRDGQPQTSSDSTPPGTPRLTKKFRYEPWMDDSLCAQTDPEAFFPEKGGSTREAKAVCGRCTVSAECLDYALDNQERYGIWGGHSERERRKLTRLLFPTAQPEDPSNEDLDNHLETA